MREDILKAREIIDNCCKVLIDEKGYMGSANILLMDLMKNEKLDRYTVIELYEELRELKEELEEIYKKNPLNFTNMANLTKDRNELKHIINVSAKYLILRNINMNMKGFLRQLYYKNTDWYVYTVYNKDGSEEEIEVEIPLKGKIEEHCKYRELWEFTKKRIEIEDVDFFITDDLYTNKNKRPRGCEVGTQFGFFVRDLYNKYMGIEED